MKPFEEVVKTPNLGGIIVPRQFDRQVDRLPDPPGGAGGGAAAPSPFQLVDASTTAGTPAANITVTYGILYAPMGGGAIPVTLGGDDIATAPLLNFASADTFIVYLEANLDLQTCTVESTTSTVPADDYADGISYLILGVVVVETSGSGLKVSSIASAMSSSLSLRSCSNGSGFFIWSSI